jgi:SWI/SNF-related matrix-associated actin-dependent regulator of chromatin subfamily A3
MIASWSLNVIIYGPVSLEKTVGDFMTSCQMYLQDPLCCDHSVVYRNPHIMSSETGETIMTDCFQSTLGNLEIERLDVGPDLLAQLMEDETPLRETDAPAIVTATLFPYFTPH